MTFLDKISIRDFVVGGATLIGSTGAFWAGYSAVMAEVDHRIQEIAAGYHDADMRRRDLNDRIASLEAALEKASPENEASIANLLEALKAERQELDRG